MSLLDTGWELNTPTVLSDVIDGETLIIQLRTGSYFVLPPSAEQLWRALAGGVPGATLLDGPGDPRRAALTGFVERAVTAGLLRQSAADAVILDRPSWEVADLELEEHAGMSDLVGADTSVGWGGLVAVPDPRTGTPAGP